MTHSYVRGKFRSRAVAAPIILAKCCHDLDLMAWLVAAMPLRVASFGRLSHYRPEAAPDGAPERCTDGCPVQARCVHDAVRFYLGPDDKLARSWPWADVSLDPSREARQRALEQGRYGRCVYHCDNDVPDHQTALIEFENGVQGTFTLQGHATHETRTLRISGSEGELRGLLREGAISVSRHGVLETEQHDLPAGEAGHFGGDTGLLDHFTDVVARDAAAEVRTSGRVSLISHVLGFAAETARADSRIVSIENGLPV
jgi:predicted dehydrogenase